LHELGFDGAEPAATGRPSYHPAVLLKIYIYGYLNQVQSSRRLEREAQRNVELMWLTGRLAPDFKTIADFRKDHGDAIRKVCREFVLLCRRLRLFADGIVAIDGSKFKGGQQPRQELQQPQDPSADAATRAKHQPLRRPRAEWLIQRDTHEALISEHEAEAILSQVERSLGKRTRASPLLLTGLLETDGESWHSDGCGFYRLGKGRKLMAAHVEQAVLGRLQEDLMAEETVDRVRASMQAIAAGEHVDGRRIAGLERRANSLSNEISRTVGLASQISDPAPVLGASQI
jgi:transposase